MGDGLLAIFNMSDRSDAPGAAVAAAAEVAATMASMNRRRASVRLIHTGFSLALNAGDVLYGNIGAERRLDFTVIGPAVKATTRIQEMCRRLEEPIIVSSRVASAVISDRDDLVSLGRYKLRGFTDPQELFTLTGAN